MLELVGDLIAKCDAQQLRFCHWKSNDKIAQACDGKGDLDLLFDRSQYAEVSALLLSLGFKRLESGFDRQFPGVEDFLGLDVASGKLVHLQAHWCLVTGQPLLKNYHIAVEDMVLASVVRDAVTGMPVPSSSMEAAIHVLRSFIKIGYNKALRPRMYRRLVSAAAEELRLLREQPGCDPVAAFNRMCPWAKAGSFQSAMDCLEKEAAPYQWLKARSALGPVMASFCRRRAPAAFATYLFRRVYLLLASRVQGKTPRRQLATGGYGIAIIGSDGAGKSTAVAAQGEWLGKRLSVHRFHMGKPPQSLRTTVLAYAVGLCRRLDSRWDLPKPARDNTVAWPSALALLPALLLWSLARDRYRHYRHARQKIGSGHIVIFDRFPLPGLALMEGPLIEVLGKDGGLIGALAKAEQTYYASMMQPELVVALVVTPEVAAERQAGDGYDYVIRRAGALKAFVSSELSDCHVVDADASLEKVQDTLRRLVWSRL